MNRRNFLKALGFGSGATALSACGVDDNLYYTPIEKVLPFVTRPEQTTPGTNSNFATSIGTGPRAWPNVAVHRDGRVINVGANAMAPVPRSVPSAFLFELQRHYSPDRRTGPTKGGSAIAWEAGMAELAAGVKAARDAGRRVVWVGPYRNGAIADLIRSYTGGNALFWEPAGLEAEALAARALFGADSPLPRYNLGEARFILSFGAPFLSDAWGNVGLRSAFARARDARVDGHVAQFEVVTPHKDQTAGAADRWHACAPGTEALVAMAVARALAEMKAYQGPARAMIDAVDLDKAAAESGVPKETIQLLASIFQAGGAVALPGGVNGAGAAATELAAAVYVLNLLADQRNLFSVDGYTGPVSSFGDVEQLITDMESGAVGALLLDDVDPVYALPGGERFQAAMAKVPFVATTSSHPNETNAQVALALPTNDVFEDWGDEEPWAGFHIVRQPGARPVHDTRSLGDVLLESWRAVDAAGAPAGTWRDYLQARWRGLYAQTSTPPAPAVEGGGDEPASTGVPAVDEAGFGRWWEEKLIAGFHETRAQRRAEVVGVVPFTGSAAHSGSGELFLHVFAHPFVLDGRYANEPWAWETPEPMTGHMWDVWALLHPDTAARLGVGDNDEIELTTDAGSIRVGVEVHPCVRPDVVAVPMGGGHTPASGRYADGVGVNVLRLLAPTRDGSGAFAWQQAKCSAKPTGARADLVSQYGADHDEGRNFAVVVDAEEWSHAKDAPSEHPGHLTGIHHLAMDARLVEREEAWRAANPGVEPEIRKYTSMYPVPEHPTYRFAMTIDTNACNGCGACMVACAAENNIPTVGKWKVKKRRAMNWIRMDRFFGEHSADGSPSVHFVPVPCQHCAHAPCESVCPVLATYHTIDGLNAMVYNRCVGTRYCANACPYSARRFNYHSYVWPEPFNLQLNPDVTARTMGVMEKCTFCVQRIRGLKAAHRSLGFTNTVPNEALEQLTACAEACPSQAITFGNLVDPESTPARSRSSGRSYLLLPELNTYPAINYLARASFHVHRPHHGSAETASSGHGGEEPHTPAEPAGH